MRLKKELISVVNETKEGLNFFYFFERAVNEMRFFIYIKRMYFYLKIKC